MQTRASTAYQARQSCSLTRSATRNMWHQAACVCVRARAVHACVPPVHASRAYVPCVRNRARKRQSIPYVHVCIRPPDAPSTASVLRFVAKNKASHSRPCCMAYGWAGGQTGERADGLHEQVHTQVHEHHICQLRHAQRRITCRSTTWNTRTHTTHSTHAVHATYT